MHIDLRNKAEIELAREICVLTPNGRDTCEVQASSFAGQWFIEPDSVDDAYQTLRDAEKVFQRTGKRAKAKTACRLADALGEWLASERCARSMAAARPLTYSDSFAEACDHDPGL